MGPLEKQTGIKVVKNLINKLLNNIKSININSNPKLITNCREDWEVAPKQGWQEERWIAATSKTTDVDEGEATHTSG